MSVLENIKGKFKEFGPTTWAIKNRTSIYLMMLFVSAFGVYQFVTLPKEQFPDIVIPGYHMNKKHWNTVIVTGKLSSIQICEMIDDSYNLVCKKANRTVQ